MDSLYHANLDCKVIQKLQNDLCAVTGICAFCVDSDGMNMTEVSGDEQDKTILLEKVPKEKMISLFNRISESSLEDQAVEDTEIETLKYAAVCIREKGKPVLTWMVYAVLSDGVSQEGRDFAERFRCRTTARQFDRALDLMRELGRRLVDDSILLEHARAESLRNQYSRETTEAMLRRSEITMEIVQMLDSDAPLEEVLGNIFAAMGRFLQIDCAYLCSVDGVGEGQMNVIAEWCDDGVLSRFDQTRNQIRPSFLYREKPLVLSSGSGREGYEKDMEQAGIKALAAIPVVLKDRISMYACFEVKRGSRNWEVEEIKFLNGSVKVLQSILTKRIQKNSLADSYASLEEVLNNVSIFIYVRDKESGEILFANRRMRKCFRKEMDENLLPALFESKIDSQCNEGSVEIFLKEDGSWYDFFYKYITWVDGRQALMCSIYDETEKKTYEKKIERQAYTDFLTGLYNRMCCERDLARHVDGAKKENREGAVLYMDLDDFKHINDSLGHQYGDVLLKSIAQGMKNVRGIQNSCYRMGGDEFVIIVAPDQYEMLDEIVESIRSVFGRPWFLKDADYYCTMSMGVVHFPSEGEGVQELIRKADIAMYEAKKAGKNRVAVYNSNIKTDSDKRLDMEKNMRDAAMDGYKEFEVYYQPIVDIQENNICTGAEALIRWNSEEMGFMSPADFIPLAEYLGLINPIGSHVLRQACQACKRWNDSGHPGYKVNVNLSVVQLLQQDIVKTIEDILGQTKLNPRNLTLEVTEGLAINDLERMKTILAQIKELGVRIALDDFGTGYSSLSHIRELPFDVIKVDQSFVKDLAEDTYSKSFIKMVSDLADAIDVSICVEGIETEQQYKVLEGMKVRMIQGYYFDKPMPSEEFEKKYVRSGAADDRVCHAEEEGKSIANVSVGEKNRSITGSKAAEENERTDRSQALEVNQHTGESRAFETNECIDGNRPREANKNTGGSQSVEGSRSAKGQRSGKGGKRTSGNRKNKRKSHGNA